METITFDKRNYRKHSDENKRVIKKSLEELGAGRVPRARGDTGANISFVTDSKTRARVACGYFW